MLEKEKGRKQPIPVGYRCRKEVKAYFVEAIIGRRPNRLTLEYRVKWDGYPISINPEEDWLRVDDFVDHKDMILAYDERLAKLASHKMRNLRSEEKKDVKGMNDVISQMLFVLPGNRLSSEAILAHYVTSQKIKMLSAKEAPATKLKISLAISSLFPQNSKTYKDGPRVNGKQQRCYRNIAIREC